MSALPALPEAVARLDVRSDAAFAAGHLAGCGHLPLAQLAARRTELPPRSRAILTVADNAATAHAAAELLESFGYADVAFLDAALSEVPGGLADRSTAIRLWQPAPFLEELLPRLPRGRALDVAAGHGRDSVFLALHGWQVEAWDRAPEALDDAAVLAAHHGVTVRTRVCDLESDAIEWPLAAFDLIVCFRFLHRPLFPRLEQALRPGGALVYETFRLGQERYGRPVQPRFLLKPDELSSAFPTLDVLHYAEQEPAGGPLTARLLAVRPLGLELPGEPRR